MKKVLLILLACTAVASVTAQELQRNIVGITAGANISSLAVSGTFLNIDPASKVGFHAGVSYQRLLLPSKPLYLETGIFFSQKGATYKDAPMELDLNLGHIQIPVLINYRIELCPNFAITPALGFYYSCGIYGNYKLSGTTGDADLDEELKGLENNVVYGDKGEFKRSNIGARLALGFDWKRLNITAGYERDLLNNSKIQKGVNDNASTINKTWTLSAGWRF